MSSASQIHFPESGPAPDVLVVGGGIIGTLTALSLADRGLKVVVVERSVSIKESSWAGAGILSPIYPWKYPDALSHLVNYSLDIYPELIERLQETSGVDPQMVTSGLIIPVYQAGEWEALSEAAPWSQKFGWQVERLTAEEARTVEPCLGEGLVGAMYWPEVAQVRNPRLTQAARYAAQSAGVEFHTDQEVTEIVHRQGRVEQVRCHDNVFTADRFVIASGSWSGGLAAQVGLNLPVQPVKGQILLLKAEPGRLKHIIKHDQAYLVPRTDGHILVGATMEMAGFDRATTLSAMHFLSGALLSMAPSLADAEVAQQWTGLRPGTPDGLPYLGAAPGFDNLYVAAGHYRNGVVLSPATANVMADLICGDTPAVSEDVLSAFAVDRATVDHAELGLPERV